MKRNEAQTSALEICTIVGHMQTETVIYYNLHFSKPKGEMS